MGLMANCFRHHHQAAPPEGNAHALLPGNWGSQHQWWKFIAPQDASAVLVTAAHPVGHYLPRVWQAPISVGEMSLRTDGAGDLTGNLIPSRAMALDMTGSGDLEATAGLAVAMALAALGGGAGGAGSGGGEAGLIAPTSRADNSRSTRPLQSADSIRLVRSR